MSSRAKVKMNSKYSLVQMTYRINIIQIKMKFSSLRLMLALDINKYSR